MQEGIVRYTLREPLRPSTIRWTLLNYGSGTASGIPAGALVDRDGNPILDRDGNYIIVGGTRPAPTSWTYASLTAAEASGDPWADGNQINITGGATFLYYTALDTAGHSGLVHKNPYGDSDELSAVALRNAEGANTDPDAWTGWTDVSTGTKGVDYDFDVATNSRFKKITISGRANLQYQTVNSADTEHFVVARDLSWNGTQAATLGAGLYNNTYRDASNYDRVVLFYEYSVSATNWSVYKDPGAYTATSKAIGTAAHVWMYAKQGKCAVWFDDDATPEISGVAHAVGSAATFACSLFSGTSGAGYPGTANTLLSSLLHGGMTTA